jgi:hypothetical protein
MLLLKWERLGAFSCLVQNGQRDDRKGAGGSYFYALGWDMAGTEDVWRWSMCHGRRKIEKEPSEAVCQVVLSRARRDTSWSNHHP